MMQQNLKSYPRIFPFGAIVTFVFLITGFFLAGMNVFRNKHGNSLIKVLILIIFVVFGLMYYYSRLMALRAQNRAIIAEENLRHTLLTGKALNSSLQLNQIIALRLASDEQLPSLAQLSVENRLSNREIKKQIKNLRNNFK